MKRLAVNVDHVATLRQARLGSEPDPVIAAGLAELAGADGIIVHLREDRRHIQDRDLRLLKETVKSKLNLEMAATDEMIKIAKEIKPDLSTLVPEKRQELTTEGGLDVVGQMEHIKEAVKELKASGVLVSLFIDADSAQIKAAKEVGADIVELHTGHYADATGEEQERLLKKILDGVLLAHSEGLSVSVGHGLNYLNIKPFLNVREIEEFSIGHSIISRAIMVGIYKAVEEMVNLIRQGS